MNILKKLGAALLVIVLLLLAAVAMAVLFIDPNSLKPEVTQVVKDKTGADIVLKDRLAWHFWPEVGISLGQVTFTQPGEVGVLAEVGRAAVSVEVMPLFSGKVVVKSVLLDGAALNYHRYADGHSNWDAVFKKLAHPEESKSSHLDLNVHALAINHSGLGFTDDGAKMGIRLQDVAVAIKDMSFEKDFPIDVDFQLLQQLGDKELQSHQHLHTVAWLTQDGSRINLHGLKWQAGLKGSLLPAPVDVAFGADVEANMALQHHHLRNVDISLRYAAPALPKPASMQLVATQLDANLRDGNVSSQGLVVDAQWPGIKKVQPLDVQFDGDFVFNIPASTLAIAQYVVKAADVEAKGGLTVILPKAGSPLTILGPLQVAEFNPHTFAHRMGVVLPAMADEKALKRLSLSARLDGQLPKFMLRDMSLIVDETHVTGEAGVESLSPLRPVAHLALDKMDLDRYMPPAATAPAAVQQSAPVVASAGILPVSLLRSLNGELSLQAASLTAMKWPMQNFQMAVNADAGKVQLSRLGGKVFDGSVNVSGSIDVRGNEPTLNVAPSINGVEVGPLAHRLLGQDLFAGKAAINGRIDMRGNDLDAWKKSAQGVLNIGLANGLLHGANLMGMVQQEMGKYATLAAALSGKDVNALTNNGRDTEIVSLKVDSQLAQGVVTQSNILADLRRGKLTGSGSFNLLQNRADYKLAVQLDKNAVGERYSKYPIPIRCSGVLTQAARLCGVDSQAVSQMAAGAIKEQATQKVEEKIQEKLKGSLNPGQQQTLDSLRKLLGR